MPERYLHFENIDMREPDVRAHCSKCGLEFCGKPEPTQRAEDVIMRLRAEFAVHTCEP